MTDNLTEEPFTFDELYSKIKPNTVITIDWRVQTVLEFISRMFPADQLRGIAEATNEVAQVLWSAHTKESINALHLEGRFNRDLPRQSISNE